METEGQEESNLLSEVEAVLKKKFSKEEADKKYRVPSSARASASSERLEQLILPDEMRPKMPFTKDKFLVKDNPHLVAWEREVRKFLRQLSPRHSHRVSAVMVYEWATGIRVAELQEQGGSATSDLRKISQCLRYYFGKPYMTHIVGRKVPNAYKIPEGWYVRRHRPQTLTLYAEYLEGSLYP